MGFSRMKKYINGEVMKVSKQVVYMFFMSILCIASVSFYSDLTSQEPQRINIVEEPITHDLKGALVFDLGGVLLKTDRSAAMDFLGKGFIAHYIWSHRQQPTSMLPLLYEILNDGVDEPNKTLKDPYGNVLPHLFAQVLKGKLTEQECLVTAHKIIYDEKNLTRFHKDESVARNSRTIASRLAQILFEPEVFVKTQRTHPQGEKLLRACQRSSKCEILIFSNFSEQAFKKVQEKYPNLFTGIKDENIIVSGKVGHAKPDPEMYQILLNRLSDLGIEPDQTYFIDDQEENTESATLLGIKGIHCKDPSKAHKLLKRQGII